MLMFRIASTFILIGVVFALLPSVSFFGAVAFTRVFGQFFDSFLETIIDIILFFPFGLLVYTYFVAILTIYWTIMGIRLLILFFQWLR